MSIYLKKRKIICIFALFYQEKKIDNDVFICHFNNTLSKRYQKKKKIQKKKIQKQKGQKMSKNVANNFVIRSYILTTLIVQTNQINIKSKETKIYACK